MKLCKRLVKKCISLFLLLNILLLSTLQAAAVDEIKMEEIPEINATSYMLIDKNSEKVLTSYNENAKVYPASTTKILTAMVVLENANLTDMVEMTNEIYNLTPIGSSHANIDRGEILSVEDLLYCIMLPSANEAANMLAFHVGGDIDGFVSMMNKKAKEIGLTNSNFVNPHGFHDENHYTTAADMAKLVLYATENEKFNEIANTAQKKLPASNTKSQERTIYTSNYLMYRTSDPRFYQYAIGIKTGYTDDAGHCLISRAVKGDEDLISIMYHVEKEAETGVNLSFEKTKELFEWGFDNHKIVTLIDTKNPVVEAQTRLSAKSDYISLRPAESLTAYMPIDFDIEKVESKYNIEESYDAPITKNQPLGTVSVYYDGEFCGTTDLLAVSDVERSEVLYYVDLIENFFSSATFKIILGSIFLIFVLSILIRRSIIKRRRRIRRRRQMKNASIKSANYKGRK